VLPGRDLCVWLITRPEESYRLWCVSDCDREASTMRRAWPSGDFWEKKIIYAFFNGVLSGLYFVPCSCRMISE
jgi:hypothetical protein